MYRDYALVNGEVVFRLRRMSHETWLEECEKCKIHAGGEFEWVPLTPTVMQYPKDKIVFTDERCSPEQFRRARILGAHTYRLLLAGSEIVFPEFTLIKRGNRVVAQFILGKDLDFKFDSEGATEALMATGKEF